MENNVDTAGERRGKLETKKIFTSLRTPGISASHPHAGTHTLTGGSVTCSPVFFTQLPLHCFILQMCATVFFNKNLCLEERATVEQSRTEMIAYQREVCS